MLSACPRKAVVLRLAPILRFAPLGLEPALLLEAVQSGKERPGLHVEGVARDLGYASGDPQAVVGSEEQRAQDQQVQSALKQSAFRRRHYWLLNGLAPEWLL